MDRSPDHQRHELALLRAENARMPISIARNGRLTFAPSGHAAPCGTGRIWKLESRLRHNNGKEAAQLAALLIKSYQSPHTVEAMPGLRQAIDSTRDDEAPARVRALLEFLNNMQSPYDVIDINPRFQS